MLRGCVRYMRLGVETEMGTRVVVSVGAREGIGGSGASAYTRPVTAVMEFLRSIERVMGDWSGICKSASGGRSIILREERDTISEIGISGECTGVGRGRAGEGCMRSGVIEEGRGSSAEAEAEAKAEAEEDSFRRRLLCVLEDGIVSTESDARDRICLAVEVC